MSNVHVFPVHVSVSCGTRSSDGCICGPDLERVDGGWVVTHHALDGREHHEPDHDRAACPLCS